MKSSDLKVVAIILSIALFFTIITSNAVSIASVVILAKGGSGTGAATQTVAPGTGDQQGATNNGGGTTSTTPGGTTSTTPGDTSSTTPGGTTSTTPGGTTSTTPGGSTSTTPGGTTQTTPGGSTSTQQGGTTQQGGNAADANDPIIKDPLGTYQKAAKAINQNGIAGYNKIGWQVPLKIEGLGFLDSVIMPILEGFMTTEDEAEVKVNAKGSDDAKNRMPPSDCSASHVKSATAEKLSNGNYKVVIVMKEVSNPSYQDTDGLVKMSKEFLDYADVQKEAKNIPIVKSLEGEIKYVDYTITAEMTKDGKFVSITHQGIGYIKANLNGSINATGELEFNAKYTDFQY
ncbi:MAG: hypothetical protein E7556_06405 [Ruminococcaceae bacterium]|nr:hypothetical protein [Oscillospiraceae bacterium]